jgi:hypothetical protein
LKYIWNSTYLLNGKKKLPWYFTTPLWLVSFPLWIFLFFLPCIFFLYSYIHMCIHMFGSFLLRHLPLPLNPLASRQNQFCPFLQFSWREEISNNKKDKAFLLVEIRIAYREIPSIDSMHKCITTQIDSSLPDLFATSWSPSHTDLCDFKVTVLAPQQWGLQVKLLTCFLTILNIFYNRIFWINWSHVFIIMVLI